jgi:hypothetical protein
MPDEIEHEMTEAELEEVAAAMEDDANALLPFEDIPNGDESEE